MKINKSQLVELLTEKTGIEKEEVEQQLKELIKRIKDAAGRGKALEIKNFGLFYFDTNKNLRFDPADSFRTEVNFKYAGLEPVEVKPPRDSSSPADKPGKEKEEPEEEDIFGLEDASKEVKEGKKKGKMKEDEEKPSPVFELDDGSPSEKPEVEDDPFKELLGDIKIEPEKEKEIKKAGTTPAVSVSTQSGKKKKQTKKAQPKKSQPPKKKKKDPVMLVMAVILAFVIVVAGFFIINDMMDTPPPQEPASPDASGITEQQEIIEPAPEPEPADVVEPDSEPGPTLQQPEPAPVTETVYGLTGSVVDEANDGYSIVLHSVRNNNSAQAAAENLRRQGYRTIVSERTVDGATVFRVAVGQFPTVREAQEKAAELPEPYRNQNFIQRIQ